mmetsp:Transcript_42777/g.100281  ORF Transcript_42777/g.100281 Transcript_42777/m.100281 type:complete len:300 (-) Transcript_42777:46-945(-)
MGACAVVKDAPTAAPLPQPPQEGGIIDKSNKAQADTISKQTYPDIETGEGMMCCFDAPACRRSSTTGNFQVRSQRAFGSMAAYEASGSGEAEASSGDVLYDGSPGQNTGAVTPEAVGPLQPLESKGSPKPAADEGPTWGASDGDTAERRQSRKSADMQVMDYKDGSTYVGEILDGLRHGHGIWVTSTTRYEGAWVDDKPHGQGQQQWHDGRVYTGQFHQGTFAGDGEMIWHTQSGNAIYQGQYQDDVKHGLGKFVWPSGHAYDGQWAHGKRHGQGTYTSPDGEACIGMWENGSFVSYVL